MWFHLRKEPKFMLRFLNDEPREADHTFYSDQGGVFYLKGFIEDIAGFLNSMNDSVTKGGEEDEGVFYYF